MNFARRYFDNAATSFPKPPAVIEAMTRYMTEIGTSPGRGSYAECAEAGQIVHECRERICNLIGGIDPDHIVFTLNCTDALNLALIGLISDSDPNHAICTALDHNSVVRPLNALVDQKRLALTQVSVDPDSFTIDPDQIQRAIRPDTRLIVMTHVSNVTGAVQNIRAVGQIARAAKIPFVLDAAQSVGHLPIDVEAEYIDLLAASGHKYIMGPLGTGFLYVRPTLANQLKAHREGGTGSSGENDRQPAFMPDKFEAGSRNMVGIAGLLEALNGSPNAVWQTCECTINGSHSNSLRDLMPSHRFSSTVRPPHQIERACSRFAYRALSPPIYPRCWNRVLKS